MYNDCTIYIYYNYCVQMRPQTPFYFIIVNLLCYHCLVFRVHVISSSFVGIFVSIFEWCTIELSTSNDMKFTELTVL